MPKKKVEKIETQPPMLIGNWKMQLSLEASVAVASALVRGMKQLPSPVQMVVCPSYPALSGVASALQGSSIGLGAQDLSWADHGAYTGDVGAAELREAGCSHVIVGHSERRKYHLEDDDTVARKFAAALRVGLAPILCVGETYAERKAGEHEVTVIRQIKSALQYLPPPSVRTHLYIAYEPVWVIGTGQAIEPQDAKGMAEVIFQCLVDLFPAPIVRKNIHLLYGGSVSDRNVIDFVDGALIQGVLVGSASLDATQFLAIAHALSRRTT